MHFPCNAGTAAAPVATAAAASARHIEREVFENHPLRQFTDSASAWFHMCILCMSSGTPFHSFRPVPLPSLSSSTISLQFLSNRNELHHTMLKCTVIHVGSRYLVCQKFRVGLVRLNALPTLSKFHRVLVCVCVCVYVASLYSRSVKSIPSTHEHT